MNNIVFKNAGLEKQLRQEGYAVVKILNDGDIEKMLRLYKEYYPSDSLPVYNSFALAAEVRGNISKGIQEVFQPRLAEFFDAFKITMGIFFVKNKADDNYIGIHQDPTLLKDECVEEHINFWCALQDVNADNGAMQVFPGSHLLFPPVQAVTVAAPFSAHGDLVYRQMKTIDMKAGEVLIFDNRLIHSSTSNTTDTKRVCVVLSMIPENVQWFSYYKDPKQANAPIEVYEQEPYYYLNPLWSNSQERPKTGKRIGVLDYNPVILNEEELKRVFENKKPVTDFKFRLLPA